MNQSLPQSVLLVDTDSVILQLMTNHLRLMGIAEIIAVNDGEQILDLVASHQIDFIVMDWSLPKLSGLAVFNRLQSQPETLHLPVLAISGRLRKDDFSLLDESLSSSFLPKPFSQVVFCDGVVKLWKQAKWIKSQKRTIEKKLAALVTEGAGALRELKKALSAAPHPLPVSLIALRMLRESGWHREVIAFAKEILRAHPKSVVALTELGCCMHILGQHHEALTFLNQAQDFSPANCDRLCLIGDVHLNLQDVGAARRCYQTTLGIDPEHQRAHQGLFVVDTIDEYLTKKRQDQEQVPQDFASLMNTIGIMKVRSGQVDEGIKQYLSAAQYIFKDDLLARLSFNLGLAYVRNRDFLQALKWFVQAYKLSEGQMIKVKKYILALSKRVAPGEFSSVQGADYTLSQIEVSGEQNERGQAEILDEDSDEQELGLQLDQ